MAKSPLLLLWRLKLIGRIRLAKRKMKTLAGAISILFGLLLLVFWIGSIVLRSSMVERTGEPPSTALVRLGLAAYVAFVSFSSLSFRGVYLPRPELERLFSSPVSRAAIVRYRMVGSLVTALPFTVIMGVFLAPRFASFPAAACAIGLTVPAGAVFGQALSLLSARSGGWGDRALGRVPPIALRVAGTLGIVGLFTFLAFGPGLDTTGSDDWEDVTVHVGRPGGVDRPDEPPGSFRSPTGAFASVRDRADSIAGSSVVSALTLPLEPWARALTAPDLRAAAPWLGLVALLFLLMFEGVARLGVDYREASLQTSREVETRLERIRSGQGGASVFGASRRATGWRVPWFLGRSPFGAVVWQRTTWLVRQARGTLFVAALVAVIGVVIGTRVFDDPDVGPITVGVLGVVYLASGIRADFRADLDRMESMKAWPLVPWKLFIATLLPGLLLTILVVAGMLLARAAILGQFDQSLVWTLLVVPLVAFVWVAVDNAVFLLFPVRFVPGQGSALQHTGRGFLLVMLRGLLLLVALVVAGGGSLALFYWLDGGPMTDRTPAYVAAGAWALLTAYALVVVLTGFGAYALRRFDVSKTPGQDS